MDWFADEVEKQTSEQALPPWKVLIVDDDNEVHKATKLSLADFNFQGKSIELLSVYSAQEATDYLEKHHNVAIVLLDVVMESEYAGLTAVKYIRETLNNHFTRIILRTGKITHAPINQVIQENDIDGYLVKTETVKHALHHQLYIALRSYRDLIRIQKYQKGLEAVIEAIAEVNQINEVIALIKSVILQLRDVTCAESVKFLIKGGGATKRFVGSNKYIDYLLIDEKGIDYITIENTHINNDFIELCTPVFSEKESNIFPPYHIHYFCSDLGTQTAFILELHKELSITSKKLVDLFVLHVVPKLESLLIENVSIADSVIDNNKKEGNE